MGKILVVDDEIDILEILQELLEDEGHTVTTFDSANQALECLKENSFDLIISDIKMPVMNGIEFLKSCNEIERSCYENFVFMTGFAEVTEEEATSLGAKGFFMKPLDLDKFINDMNGLLNC
jgi:DNA-binding NtrC family response regulator